MHSSFKFMNGFFPRHPEEIIKLKTEIYKKVILTTKDTCLYRVMLTGMPISNNIFCNTFFSNTPPGI